MSKKNAKRVKTTKPYSGKFTLRIPKSLHKELVVLAAFEGVSLNQLILMLVGRRNEQVQSQR